MKVKFGKKPLCKGEGAVAHVAEGEVCDTNQILISNYRLGRLE